jgi:hypothetical protein
MNQIQHSYCLSNIVSKNCDGSIWHESPEKQQSDKERDYLLAQRGWTILRFTDRVISESPQAVKQTIHSYIDQLKKNVKHASTNEDIHLFDLKLGEVKEVDWKTYIRED